MNSENTLEKSYSADFPWCEGEHLLYSRFIWDWLDEPWAIRDYCLEEEFTAELSEEAIEAASTCGSFVEDAICYISEVVGQQPHTYPPNLVRPNQYPRIRQMRDVHEFDVGAHLVLTAMLSIRRAPVVYCLRRDLRRAASSFNTVFENRDSQFWFLTSIFHDFFKCFRSRRPLPSKIGSTQSLVFKDPRTGEALDMAHLSEEEINNILLPRFVDDGDISDVAQTILLAGSIGAEMYSALKCPTADLQQSVSGIHELVGKNPEIGDESLYLAVCDALAKGHARFLTTSRKGCRHSLDRILTLLCN